MYALIKKEGLSRSSPSLLQKATLLLLLLLTWQALFARPFRKKEHELFSQEKKLIDLKIDTNIRYYARYGTCKYIQYILIIMHQSSRRTYRYRPSYEMRIFL